MNATELRTQADRCRRLAIAFTDVTRERLLDLAAEYEMRARHAEDAERQKPSRRA